MKENIKIDFVVTWLDGQDPKWLAQKEEYYPQNDRKYDLRKRRFRDWDNFQYWFRCVAKYAPWVNHIYVVTPGQTPEWLNTECEKVSVIDQNDLMEEAYTPTFNNCAIELLLHKIPNLSEHFVYFCDDMFITDNTTPRRFFQKRFAFSQCGF